MNNKFTERQFVIYKSEDFYKLGRINLVNNELVVTELFYQTHLPEMISISSLELDEVEPIFILGEEKWNNILEKIFKDINSKLARRMDVVQLLKEVMTCEITLGLAHHIDDEIFKIESDLKKNDK